MKSFRERQELKAWGGELISFSPTPSMKFGLSDEHIRAAHITAHVEASDAGTRVTATRVAAMGVFALAAKKKRADAVNLILTGENYSKVVACGLGAGARERAELFAAQVNAISSPAPSDDTAKVAAATTDVPNGPNPLDQIKQLAELKEAGAISADEFEEKKAELLRRV